MDQYMGMDIEYILGPCDVVLCAASICIHAHWLRRDCLPPANLILMLLTICHMETVVIVPVYHKLSDQAKVYMKISYTITYLN